MNKERVLQALDNLKGSLETIDYGKWGVLNVEQRNFMRALCNSWLILDDSTNKQMEEIERLKELSKVDSQQAQEIIIELNQEIERLNNIINELEKWVVESIEKYTEDYLDWKYDRNVYLAGSKKLQNVLDKLQELKGSD